MKRATICISILLLALSYSFGQNIKKVDEQIYGGLIETTSTIEGANKRKLKNQIKYPKHFNLCFNSHTIFEYDRQGSLIVKKELNEQGQIDLEMVFKDSNFISRIDYKYPRRPKSNYSLTSSYREDNLIAKSTDFSSNMIKSISTTYPKPGQKESITLVNNKIVEKCITHFDSIVISEKIYKLDNRDSLCLRTEKFYDNQNRLIKQINYNFPEQLYLTRTYAYDNSGNERYEKREFHTENKIDEIFRITDSLKQFSDFKSYVNGEIVYWSRTHFDDYDNEILIETFDNNGTVSSKISFEYKYDKKGQWTKKKEFENKELHSVKYRQIEYYK